MNPITQATLLSLHQAVDATESIEGEWALFGSASLILRGILDREPGDIDILVSRRLWARLFNRPGWMVKTPNAGDPPLLEFNPYGMAIHAFYEWHDPHVTMSVQSLLRSSDNVKFMGMDWWVIPVEDALAHKVQALGYQSSGVEKHRVDIPVIEEWLARG